VFTESPKNKDIKLTFLSTIVLLFVFSLFGELLAQEVYRWVDDKGIVHFADSLHLVPEKYRREAEKRSLPPSPDMPTPTPQEVSKQSKESALSQPGVPFIRYGKQIIVEGFINQRGPVDFAVDPGAIITIIPASIASQLGINLHNSLPFRSEGIRGVTSGRLVTIDSLRLGDVEMNEVEIAISEHGLSRIGVLGMDFLGRFRVHMDNGLNRMELVQEEEPYGGHSPEWWQGKFSLLSGFKTDIRKTYQAAQRKF
jgi:clan AA aspartic protease (TIGR02281 family)